MEGSAEEARASIQCLVKLVKHPEKSDALEAFAAFRRKDKRLTQELTEHLCKTFVTPLEREDIEALSNSLYKIPKTVQKIAERILLCPRDILKDELLNEQVNILDQASSLVVKMVKLLRSGPSLEDVVEMNSRLQQLEGEADKLVTRMLQELYQGRREAKEVIILKDVFELLERAIDRCRDAGNTVFQIVLKSS